MSGKKKCFEDPDGPTTRIKKKINFVKNIYCSAFVLFVPEKVPECDETLFAGKCGAAASMLL
jgi:hypothetical protein